MMQGSEKDREEFEAHIKQQNYFDGRLARNGDGYKVLDVNWQWIGFKAARRANVAPSDVDIAELRFKYGITSNGRGIHEFENVASFTRDALARWSAAHKPPEAHVELPEPDAWRYTDARGHFRYRGARQGFAVEYPCLKPEALYTEKQVRALLARANTSMNLMRENTATK